MLQRMYKGLDQNVFTTNRQPEPIVHIEDLEEYNEKEGLALSKEEMDYLKKVEKDLGRPLTDSEVFGLRKSTPSTAVTKSSAGHSSSME